MPQATASPLVHLPHHHNLPQQHQDTLTDPAPIRHRIQRRLELLAPNVIVIDIHPLRRQPRQRLPRLLLLIVEPPIEAQLLHSEVQLLIAAHTPNDPQALMLRDLPHDLPHRPTGRGHEDRLPPLRLADRVQRAVRRQARHAQRADEDAEGEAVRVRERREGRGLRGGHDAVLGDGENADDEVARAEFRIRRLEDFGDGVVSQGRVEVEGRGVVLGRGQAQLAAQVGVERSVDLLRENAVWGELGGVEVEGPVFDRDVLAGDGEGGRRLGEDEGFVLDHGCGKGGGVFRRRSAVRKKDDERENQ